jgi:acetyltransferase-like isoleucine patch superfamily enzyme
MSEAVIVVPPFLAQFAALRPSPWSGLIGRLVDRGYTAEIVAPETPCGARLVIDGRHPGLGNGDIDALGSSAWLFGIDGEPVAVRTTAEDVGRSCAEVLSSPSGEATPCSAPGARKVRSIPELVVALADLRSRRVQALVEEGALILDPERTWIDEDVIVEPGAVVWPDVTLRGRTVLRTGSEVQSGCWLEDTEVAAGAVVKPHSVCERARVGPGCSVGPMAHLRPGADLADGAKVGNFVEIKAARIGAGAKVSHLTYIGDAEIGSEANIGAGTITCNYDGFNKNRTVVGAGAFIGSNSSLVAPVTIGAGAIVGAGSVITRDIPGDALAVERSPLKVLDGFAPRLNEKNRQKSGK